MAASRKPKSNEPAAGDLAAHVRDVLQRHAVSGERIVVGLSGGVDSVVLLDVLQRLAGPLRFTLTAIHVNHGLSPNAARWVAFCRELCRRCAIPLRVRKVAVMRGNSTEAAARTARYAAFRTERAEFIALAHNRDDQAETLLLQLLRGAGVKGLSAMPVLRIEERGSRIEVNNAARHPHPQSLSRKEREAYGSLLPPGEGPGMRERGTLALDPQSPVLNPAFLRPLLDVPRTAIVDYARRHELQWIEDESNADIRYDRNFLRHRILPLMAQRWPAYRTTLARTARHLAQAAELLEVLAMQDACAAVDGEALNIDALRALGAARAGNVVRHLLAGHGVAMPNAARLDEFLHQLFAARHDARVCAAFGDMDLRQFAGTLHLVRRRVAAIPPVAEWHGQRRLRLPEWDGATLVMKHVRGHGIRRAALDDASVTLRPRHGGERLQPDCRRPRRSLKNLLQESRLPPWQRELLPLLFCGTALAWVPGIGVDCRFQARAGEPGLEPSLIYGQ
ncbi:MAG: tRNA lysidine(34) synthetase TilS [Burkholderiales bacterium]